MMSDRSSKRDKLIRRLAPWWSIDELRAYNGVRSSHVSPFFVRKRPHFPLLLKMHRENSIIVVSAINHETEPEQMRTNWLIGYLEFDRQLRVPLITREWTQEQMSMQTNQYLIHNFTLTTNGWNANGCPLYIWIRNHRETINEPARRKTSKKQNARENERGWFWNLCSKRTSNNGSLALFSLPSSWSNDHLHLWHV